MYTYLFLHGLAASLISDGFSFPLSVCHNTLENIAIQAVRLKM